MLALIAELLADLPLIGSFITKLTQLFTKTAAQNQQTTVQQQQDEAATLAKTGRPNPND